jgi:hypothetical protein
MGMTAEEQALHDVWMDKLQLLRGAYGALWFARIHLRDAREAERVACAEFDALVERNAEAVAEMEPA